MDKLKVNFGELTVTHSNTHIFLGMNITIRDDGKFEVNQVERLQEVTKMFGEDISKRLSSIASIDIY